MAKKNDSRKCLVAVKIRGTIRAQREVRETLRMLHLDKTNNAVLIDNRPSFAGMLMKVQAYVTWGEPSKETLIQLIKKRGRIGASQISDEYAKKLGYESIADLAELILACKIEALKLPNMSPVFRLHPPSKGFSGKTKKSYHAGGETGYRGKEINELLKRMI